MLHFLCGDSQSVFLQTICQAAKLYFRQWPLEAYKIHIDYCVKISNVSIELNHLAQKMYK